MYEIVQDDDIDEVFRQKKPKKPKKIVGAVLLSHTLMCSTIAAGALNYRVREGNVCFFSAMSTDNL